MGKLASRNDERIGPRCGCSRRSCVRRDFIPRIRQCAARASIPRPPMRLAMTRAVDSLVMRVGLRPELALGAKPVIELVARSPASLEVQVVRPDANRLVSHGTRRCRALVGLTTLIHLPRCVAGLNVHCRATGPPGRGPLLLLLHAAPTGDIRDLHFFSMRPASPRPGAGASCFASSGNDTTSQS